MQEHKDQCADPTAPAAAAAVAAVSVLPQEDEEMKKKTLTDIISSSNNNEMNNSNKNNDTTAGATTGTAEENTTTPHEQNDLSSSSPDASSAPPLADAVSHQSEPARRRVRFRTVRPTDIPACYKLERSNYPRDEAATKSMLQYRQHHAAPYFRCAVLKSKPAPSGEQTDGALPPTLPPPLAIQDEEDRDDLDDADDDDDDQNTLLLGFVCSTRCKEFTEESMSTHVSDGPLLAIHSVVVAPEYQRQGIATAMLRDYIQTIQDMNHEHQNQQLPSLPPHAKAAASSGGSSASSSTGSLPTAGTPISKIVLLAKKELLTFYIDCGFHVMRRSAIVHGKDPWYELEYNLLIEEMTTAEEATAEVAEALTTNSGRQPQGVPCFIVDAFVDPKEKTHPDQVKLRTGNPAAVVLFESNNSHGENDNVMRPTWMQKVANEFNLSETAFVCPLPTPPGTAAVVDRQKKNELHYTIRYFTPAIEVDLCGHATLASAAVVYQTVCDNNEDATLVFHAKQDVLRVSYVRPDGPGQHFKLSMQFPCLPATEVTDSEAISSIHSMLQSAFSIQAQHILFVGVSSKLGDLLVELSYDSFQAIDLSSSTAGGHRHDLNALLNWEGYTRGVILCCLATPPVDLIPEKDEYDDYDDAYDDSKELDTAEHATATTEMGTPVDFFSRFFAPKAGIDEDPVTGSAHCALAPYFSQKLGRDRVVGGQRSARGGVLECRLVQSTVSEEDGEKMIATVEISGSTATAVSGILWL